MLTMHSRRYTKPRVLSLGIFSEGTMRTEDVGDSLASILGDIRLTRLDRASISAWYRERAQGDDASDEKLSDLCTVLWNMADDYAPAWSYAGASEGDGACFGIWPCVDAVQQDDDVLKVSDLAEIPKGYTGEALLVNDHGNCTLYNVKNGRAREVWSVA